MVRARRSRLAWLASRLGVVDVARLTARRGRRGSLVARRGSLDGSTCSAWCPCRWTARTAGACSRELQNLDYFWTDTLIGVDSVTSFICMRPRCTYRCKSDLIWYRCKSVGLSTDAVPSLCSSALRLGTKNRGSGTAQKIAVPTPAQPCPSRLSSSGSGPAPALACL